MAPTSPGKLWKSPQLLPSPLSGPEPALGESEGHWMEKKEGQGTDRSGASPASTPHTTGQFQPLCEIPGMLPFKETLHAKIHTYQTDTSGWFLHYKRILCLTRGLSTWET